MTSSAIEHRRLLASAAASATAHHRQLRVARQALSKPTCSATGQRQRYSSGSPHTTSSATRVPRTPAFRMPRRQRCRPSLPKPTCLDDPRCPTSVPGRPVSASRGLPKSVGPDEAGLLAGLDVEADPAHLGRRGGNGSGLVLTAPHRPDCERPRHLLAVGQFVYIGAWRDNAHHPISDTITSQC